MRPFLLAVAVIGSLSAVRLAGDDTGKTDKDEMQDTWAVVAMESNGRKEELGQAAKDGSARMVVTADTLRLSLPGTLLGEDEATYRIDPGKKPREIDLTFRKEPQILLKGKTWQGIYSLRGDKLKICFDTSGKGRPDAFVTKEKDGCLLIYLERE